MASGVRYQRLNSTVNTASNLNEDRGRTTPQRPWSEIRNGRFYPDRFFHKSRSRSGKGAGRIDETERYVRVGIKNRHGVYLLWLELNVATAQWWSAWNDSVKDKKTSSLHYAEDKKMVEEMQRGMEQTVSSKMPIPRDLSVSLKLKRLVVLCFCRLQFMKYLLRL